MNMDTVTFVITMMMMMTSIWSSPIVIPNDNNNNNNNESLQKIESIGEAFRRKLTEEDKNENNGRILIDHLSSNEDVEFKRTGKLPIRTQLLIENFLLNTPDGRKMLEQQQRHQPSTPIPIISMDPIVSLKPYDRYEIIPENGNSNNNDGNPMIITDEHEFQQQSPSPSPSQQSSKISTTLINIDHNNDGLINQDQNKR